ETEIVLVEANRTDGSVVPGFGHYLHSGRTMVSRVSTRAGAVNHLIGNVSAGGTAYSTTDPEGAGYVAQRVAEPLAAVRTQVDEALAEKAARQAAHERARQLAFEAARKAVKSTASGQTSEVEDHRNHFSGAE